MTEFEDKSATHAKRYIELRLEIAEKFNEALALIPESELEHMKFLLELRRNGFKRAADHFNQSKRERLNALVHNYADPALRNLIYCIMVGDRHPSGDALLRGEDPYDWMDYGEGVPIDV
jgi:hypothetical protein